MSSFKDPRFRSTRLLQFARGKTCVQCGMISASEGAHISTTGVGMGQKNDDFMVMHLCRHCHTEHDTVDRGDYRLKMEMLRRTLKRLFREGIICVQKP